MSQLVWQKSSFSTGGQGECIEVASSTSGRIHVRESDRPGDVITADSPTWGAFLEAVKAGEFDDIVR